MNKKILLFIGLFVIAIIIGVFLYYQLSEDYPDNTLGISPGHGEILQTSLALLKEGKYDEGLSKCDEVPYGNAICYNSYFVLRLSNNESIDRAICERITMGDIPDGKEWEQYKIRMAVIVQDSKQKCYDLSS